MNRTRNLAFITLSSLFLCGVIALTAAQELEMPLPEFIASEDATFLSGGITESKLNENLNINSFFEKRFQKSLETEIENRVPAKTTALLGNATLQRTCIQLANAPFSWECYPTQFDSSYVYIPSQDAIANEPMKITSNSKKALLSFVSGYKRFAEKYPEKRFVLFIPQMSSTAAINPAVSLSAKPFTVDTALDLIHKKQGDLPSNLALLTRQYKSLNDYYSEYFRSDHHWNARGTEESFNLIADTIGVDKFETSDWISLGDYRYTGAYSRNGLMLISEEVFDSNCTFQDFTFTIGNDEFSYNHEKFFKLSDAERRFKFYDDYLDLGAQLTTRNSAKESNALLLGDSYEGSFARILAEQYGSVTVSRQLHSSANVSGMTVDSRFSELLETSDFDDIYVVAHLPNLVNTMTYYPNYFEL